MILTNGNYTSSTETRPANPAAANLKHFHLFSFLTAAIVLGIMLPLNRLPGSSQAPERGTNVYYWPGIRAVHPVPIKWEKLDEGLERTNLKFEGTTKSFEKDELFFDRIVELVIFRINTERFPVRIITSIGLNGAKKSPLKQVHEKIGALLTVNGGYFDSEDNSIGLIISDGVKRSQWDEEGGSGAFAIFGKTPRIDWANKIAEANPRPHQALQNGPMLVDPGGDFGMFHLRDKYFSRTIIALDKENRLLIAVTRKRYGEDVVKTGVNLFEAAAIFYNPISLGGLAANVVLNLDGGTSTGMKFNYKGQSEEVRVGITLPNFVCVMPH